MTKSINQISISNTVVLYYSRCKPLGKAHVKKKREELEMKYKKIYGLHDPNSTVIYRRGIQRSGCIKRNNQNIIKHFQKSIMELVKHTLVGEKQ